MKVRTMGCYPSLGHSTVKIELTETEHEVLCQKKGNTVEFDNAARRLAYHIAASVSRWKESESFKEEVEAGILD